MVLENMVINKTIDGFNRTERSEPKMLPSRIPALKGQAAKQFLEQDKKPLSSAEKASLEACRALYRKNPLK